MSFIRHKEIPPHSGNWYAYEVETYKSKGHKRQRVLKYIGKNDVSSPSKNPSKNKPPIVVRGNKKHPYKNGVLYSEAFNFVVMIRKEKQLSLDKLKSTLDSTFPHNIISRSCIMNWIKPLGITLPRGGWNKRTHLYIPNPDSLIIARESNTGITLIDKFTKHIRDRDFRNDIRQEAALLYLEYYGVNYELTELEAKMLIKKAIISIYNTTYSSKYNSVSLYKAIGNEENDRRLLDIIQDNSIYGINPIDKICIMEANKSITLSDR